MAVRKHMADMGAGYSGAASGASSTGVATPQNQWAGTVFNFSSAGAGNTSYQQEQTLSQRPDATATTAYGGDAQSNKVEAPDAASAGSGEQGAGSKLLYASLGLSAIGLFIALRK